MLLSFHEGLEASRRALAVGGSPSRLEAGVRPAGRMGSHGGVRVRRVRRGRRAHRPAPPGGRRGPGAILARPGRRRRARSPGLSGFWSEASITGEAPTRWLRATSRRGTGFASSATLRFGMAVSCALHATFDEVALPSGLKAVADSGDVAGRDGVCSRALAGGRLRRRGDRRRGGEAARRAALLGRQDPRGPRALRS